MRLVNGWAFPDVDTFMAGEMTSDGRYQDDHLVSALTHITDWSIAVDGGAHAGLWSRRMSPRFDRVVAFEPSPDTYECLVQNMAQFGCSNVEPHQVALGHADGLVTMALDEVNAARANTGARRVESGGKIQRRTLDSYALPSLGFLKLDVEGSEVWALEGARETLRRCRPIVLFENKKLWFRHYGLRKDAVATLLTGYGYQFLEATGCDHIWGPR